MATPKIPAGFDPSNNSGMGPAALMYQKLKNEINNSLEKGKLFVANDTSLLSKCFIYSHTLTLNQKLIKQKRKVKFISSLLRHKKKLTKTEVVTVHHG